jgi:tryptophan synthase alpha chain
MSAVDDLFKRLRGEGRKALLPFITAGDPDVGTTELLIRKLAEIGADMCEIGVPYSDPIADGPVIQASYQRALEKGFKLRQLFELGQKINYGPAAIAMPQVTMVSYSIMMRIGLQRYVDQAIASGFSGAIVPDLLVEEAEEASRICRAADFSLIQLVTPTTPRERQKKIAELSTGFLYVVSVTGITGERTQVAPGLLDNVAWLREQTQLPICIGFGISSPEHVQQMAPAADGLIVGSAFVRRIATAGDQVSIVREVGQFANELLSAIRQPLST